MSALTHFPEDFGAERKRQFMSARERGIRFGRKPLLIPVTIQQVRKLRKAGKTVPEIMHRMELSKASVYRALGTS